MKILKKYYLIDELQVKDSLGNIYTIVDLIGVAPDDILVDEDFTHAYVFFDDSFDTIILDPYEVIV